MAGNGELIRSMRAGGGAGTAAARELLRRAAAGGVSRAELKEVQRVATSPELRDAFRDVARDVSALLSGGEAAVLRDVASLAPDTTRLTDARTLPEKFLGDFTVLEQALVGQPGLTGDQKATRLFAFFETYAARFADLAHAPPLPEAALQKALSQFDKALTRAGFEQLRTDDGRTGVEAARQMLEAKTRELQVQVRPERLTAPGLRDNPVIDRSLRAEVDGERRGVQTLEGKPLIQPHLRTGSARADEAPNAEGKRGPRNKGTDQVLGGRMLWNVLHLLRGEELDDVARKEALAQLVVAASFLLIFGAIVVVVLVWV